MTTGGAGGGSALPVREQRETPPEIRSMSAIPRPDYVDVFTLTSPDASRWTAEQWARAAFEDVAGLGGQFIFRVLLGLRLAPRRSPGHVAGWRIDGRGVAERPSIQHHGEGWIRLAASSWMLTGNLILHVDGDQVSLATLNRFDRPTGRRVWRLLSPLHRALAPGVLRDAHTALTRPRGAPRARSGSRRP